MRSTVLLLALLGLSPTASASWAESCVVEARVTGVQPGKRTLLRRWYVLEILVISAKPSTRFLAKYNSVPCEQNANKSLSINILLPRDYQPMFGHTISFLGEAFDAVDNAGRPLVGRYDTTFLSQTDRSER